jgi:hypothetical protein
MTGKNTAIKDKSCHIVDETMSDTGKGTWKRKREKTRKTDREKGEEIERERGGKGKGSKGTNG